MHNVFLSVLHRVHVLNVWETIRHVVSLSHLLPVAVVVSELSFFRPSFVYFECEKVFPKLGHNVALSNKERESQFKTTVGDM